MYSYLVMFYVKANSSDWGHRRKRKERKVNQHSIQAEETQLGLKMKCIITSLE